MYCSRSIFHFHFHEYMPPSVPLLLCSKLQVVKIAAIHNVDIRLCSLALQIRSYIRMMQWCACTKCICECIRGYSKYSGVLSSWLLKLKSYWTFSHRKYVNNIFIEENRKEIYKHKTLKFYAYHGSMSCVCSSSTLYDMNGSACETELLTQKTYSDRLPCGFRSIYVDFFLFYFIHSLHIEVIFCCSKLYILCLKLTISC